MATVEVQPASTASSETDRPTSYPRSEQPAAQRSFRLPPGAVLAVVPALAIYGLFVLWPLLQMGWLALQQWNGYGPQTWVGFGNFTALWTDPVFRTSLMHSVAWELGAAAVPTLLGLTLALLLRRACGRSLLLSLLFFPVLLSPAVVAAVWTLVYSPDSGLLNTALRAIGLDRLATGWLGDPHLALGALFVAWLWSAFGISALIFWAGLQAIGREFEELALMEGAGTLWIFRHVTLAGLRRVGPVALLVNAALGAQAFDLIYVTTGGGPGYASMILPVDAYGRAFGGYTGQGAASACVQVALGLTLVLATLLILRRRGAGLDSGEANHDHRSSPLSTLAAFVVLALLLLPLGWLLPAALEPGRAFALGTASPGFDPRTWAWSNFSSVWQAGLGNAVGTSIWLAVVVMAVTVLLAAPAAFTLAHVCRPGLWQTVTLVILLAGPFVPESVLIIPLFSLLQRLGLLDTHWGIILPEIGRVLPFAVLILWGFLAGLPRDMLEAAAVDGASPRQQMVRIALPLARPALYVAAFWAFLVSWNEYLLPTIVSQDGSLQTVPTLLAGFIGKYDTQFGLLAAGTLMAMLPTLLIYLILRRPASRGLSGVEPRVR